jgi:RNA polymerase sigma-70 factor (ECF subfamily)
MENPADHALPVCRPDFAAIDPALFHKQLIAILPLLRQRALAMTRHGADADDLVQGAVLNALAARDSFIPGSNFPAWMTVILRNRFLSGLRRRRETVELEEAPAALLGRSGGQEETLAFAELHRNLARLPAAQRRVLLMIAIEGLSYDETSRELGLAVGTLKCQVFRARRQLRVWMQGEVVPARPPLPRPVRPPMPWLAASLAPPAALRPAHHAA